MKTSVLLWTTLLSVNVFNLFRCSHSTEIYRQKYAKRMASYMDKSTNPCEDFFQYACGDYNKIMRKSGKHKHDLNAELKGQIVDFMHDVLMEPVSSSIEERYSAEDKAKIFYQSCMKTDIFKYPKSEAFLKLLDSLGGWPALDPKWKPDDFDWFRFQLLATTYDAHVFILEEIGDDVIHIQSGYFWLLNRELLNLFQPYSREFQISKGAAMQIMKMYGVPKSAARKIWNEIVQFGRLWKSLEESYKWEGDTIDSIESLMEIVPNVDWGEFIKVLFGNYTELSPEQLNIYNIRHLNYIDKLFKGNERAAANYAAIELLLNLHVELIQEHNSQQFCYSQLSYLRSIEGALFLSRNPEEERIEEEVRTMVDYIKNAYRESIKGVDWLSREIKQILITKLNKLTVYFPENLYPVDFEALNEEYSDLEVSPRNDYYENYLAVKKFSQKQKHLKFLNKESIESDSPTNANAVFSHETNSISLDAGALQIPRYFPGFPSAYNFGAIGAVIAHEMGHAFDPISRYYDETGEMYEEWDSFSQDGYFERELCFLDQYKATTVREVNEPLNATISQNGNIVDCLGVRHSYFAYRKWMKMYRGSLYPARQTLPKLNVTSNQLFFLSYAQQFCTELTRTEVIESQTADHAPNRIRVIGSVSNFKEFSEAFNCDLGTPMNPAEKCTLF